MLVCLKCGTLFDEEPLKPRAGYKDSKACPVKDCGGTINDIDEVLIPALLNLNKKGYETEFSCAGHFYEECPNTYIKFKNNYKEYMKFPPEGFIMEDLINDVTVIRKSYNKSNKKDKIDMMDFLLYGIGQLNKWAEELPSLYEENQKKTLVILCDPDHTALLPDKILKRYSLGNIAFEEYCSIDFVESRILHSLGLYDILYIECNKLIISGLRKRLESNNINCADFSDNIEEALKLI